MYQVAIASLSSPFPQLILSIGVSFNRPQFSPCTSWNPNAITFTNSTQVGVGPRTVFINTKNSLYLAAGGAGKVLQFSVTNPTPIRTISNGISYPYSVFVTDDENVFVNNYGSGNAVSMWAPNATNGTVLMNLTWPCYSVFIDINSTLYCSLDANHTVLTLSLSAGTNTTSVVAGNWTSGASYIQLNTPNGMYVDSNFNLYVADCGNHRIQFFKNNQLNGTTAVGSTVPGTISLNLPTSITLDGNGYHFIVDLGNHRVVGSGPTGFRCIVGCSGQSGSLPSQLWSPRSLAFDVDGNLFVGDTSNNRIQKFLLASNSCSKLQFCR